MLAHRPTFAYRATPIATTRPPIATEGSSAVRLSTSTGSSEACAWGVNLASNGPPRAPAFTRA